MSSSIIICDKTFRSCVWIERSFLTENLAESITTTILKGFRSGDPCGNHRNPFICLGQNRPDIKADQMTQREPPQTEPLYRGSGPAYFVKRLIWAVACGFGIFVSILVAVSLLNSQGGEGPASLLNLFAVASIAAFFVLVLYLDTLRVRPLTVFEDLIEFPLRIRPKGPIPHPRRKRRISANELTGCRLRILDAKETSHGLIRDWELRMRTRDGSTLLLKPTRYAHLREECVLALQRFCKFVEDRRLASKTQGARRSFRPPPLPQVKPP